MPELQLDTSSLLSPTPCSSSTPSVVSGFSDSCSTHAGQGELEIPNHWRPEVEECFTEKCLSDRARHEIVRTLVNLLFARVKKPVRSDCAHLARKLIMKHPFVKDDLGNGYVSCMLLFVVIQSAMLLAIGSSMWVLARCYTWCFFFLINIHLKCQVSLMECDTYTHFALIIST